ncbi:hypothetical protein BT93_L3679 [Corymbia citriodora subsp. variegata]|uniref:P-type Ca(2+) transporter n=1 Tax=Corymbia citriodora subsp. variegata TaxID=360336 RepID=A0A8T0CGV5_CORYI|nr:hypothetical protein BT93_L3679 [Corymbia citriodora subsp. variegata]
MFEKLSEGWQSAVAAIFTIKAGLDHAGTVAYERGSEALAIPLHVVVRFFNLNESMDSPESDLEGRTVEAVDNEGDPHAKRVCAECIPDLPSATLRWRFALPTRPQDASTDDRVSSSQGTFRVDRTRLTELFQTRDGDQLQRMGGVAGIASALRTDMEKGISGDAEDVHLHVKEFGSNEYSRRPKRQFFSFMWGKSACRFMWDAFKNVSLVALLVCAAILLGFGIKMGGFREVFAVIIVFAAYSFWQDKQFDWLCGKNDIQVEVVRSGRHQKISIFKIVVGDVVCLNIGDKVPMGGLFLDRQSVRIHELSTTGESRFVEVDSDRPFLFSGSTVADGYGRMLVISVEMNTPWGEMMNSISRDSREQTPLQARLNKLTSSIVRVGLRLIFPVLVVVLLIRYFKGITQNEDGTVQFRTGRTTADDAINSVVGIITAAVTILVVAIPEGLPVAVALTLAYSMKRMMVGQAMVRKLSACETMASATTICVDKTGTLTMNQMKVTKFWVGQDSVAENTYFSVSKFVLDLIQDGVALNTTGSVHRPSSGSDYEFSGSPTEKAILSWAVSQLSMNMEETKKSCEVIEVEAFDSHKKRSGVLIRKSVDNTFHVHRKGAAEMVLAKCSSFYDKSGRVKDLDKDDRMRFKQIIQGMAASSLRCIAFAHKQVSEEAIKEREDGKKIQEDDLALLGFVGIKDPCHPSMNREVQACQNAGVDVKMIMGDDIFTAKAIAAECGILRPGDDASDGGIIEGAEFHSYTHAEMLERVDKIRVMARSSPFDKLLMVQCLKQKGHIVAVTGDGANDAPALKEADIGLSWKFIQFHFTVNIAALVINFVAAVSSGDVPLTAVQLLWVKLIMDTLGALALATEQPTRELMEKPPVGQNEPLITNVMWRNLVAQTIYQVVVLLTLQFEGQLIFGVDKAVKQTLIFNAFILCQVFNEFNARKLEKKNVFEGIHKNKLFLGTVFVTVVFQVMMVEFLKWFADTQRLTWGQWGSCIGIAAMSWPIGWVVKCIPVPDTPIFSFYKVVRKIVQKRTAGTLLKMNLNE